jgi:hypothetical protein
VTVTDRVGNGGAAPLVGITNIDFNDMTVNLTVADVAKTIAASDLQSIVELYTAFFNRVPDADGMVYWIGQFKGGQTIVQLANTFYGIAASTDFSALTGYSATMTSGAFVNIIYVNVLGHPADNDGLAYWTGQLDSGTQSRGQLVQSILGSAHTFKGNATLGYVADLLDNKYAVGRYFAIQQGLTFKADGFTKSSAISQAVTPTNTSVAMQKTGVSDSAFDLTAALPTGPSISVIQAIITQRCVPCHATRPTFPGYTTPQAGIILSTADQIRAQASLIDSQAVVSKAMPFGNQTAMTQAERDLIGQWFAAGAQ